MPDLDIAEFVGPRPAGIDFERSQRMSLIDALAVSQYLTRVAEACVDAVAGGVSPQAGPLMEEWRVCTAVVMNALGGAR